MRQEILGREEILGDLCGVGLIRHKFSPKVQAAKAAFLRKHGLIRGVGREEILGCDDALGAFVGDDERELAREGAGERAAMRRRTTSGYNGGWAYIRGEEAKEVAREALEELRERAKAGDRRSQKALERLKSRSSGDDAELESLMLKSLEKKPRREVAKTLRKAGPLHPAEKKQLANLAVIKEKARGGDVAAQAKVKQIKKQVGELVARAKRGDAAAARAVKILEDSDVFGSPMKMTI